VRRVDRRQTASGELGALLVEEPRSFRPRHCVSKFSAVERVVRTISSVIAFADRGLCSPEEALGGRSHRDSVLHQRRGRETAEYFKAVAITLCFDLLATPPPTRTSGKRSFAPITSTGVQHDGTDREASASRKA